MFHLSFDISAQPTRSASTVSNMPSEVRSPLTIWELREWVSVTHAHDISEDPSCRWTHDCYSRLDRLQVQVLVTQIMEVLDKAFSLAGLA